jgi:hypothetical protein
MLAGAIKPTINKEKTGMDCQATSFVHFTQSDLGPVDPIRWPAQQLLPPQR